jgi:hypothetical protein
MIDHLGQRHAALGLTVDAQRIAPHEPLTDRHPSPTSDPLVLSLSHRLSSRCFVPLTYGAIIFAVHCKAPRSRLFSARSVAFSAFSFSCSVISAGRLSCCSQFR